jgi:hypothetical protein
MAITESRPYLSDRFAAHKQRMNAPAEKKIVVI